MMITRLATARIPGDRGAPRLRRLCALAVTAGLALLAAGCGSSGPTATNGQSPQSFAAAAFKFASCMRAHGLPNFPDPVVHSSANGDQAVGIRVTPAETGTPSFQTAQHACQGILPAPENTGPSETPQQLRRKLQAELAFVRCLRSHGLSNFPDPNAQGKLSPEALTASGVDLQSPAFASAGQACLPAAAGLITPAELAQVEHGGAGGVHQSSTAGQ